MRMRLASSCWTSRWTAARRTRERRSTLEYLRRGGSAASRGSKAVSRQRVTCQTCNRRWGQTTGVFTGISFTLSSYQGGKSSKDERFWKSVSDPNAICRELKATLSHEAISQEIGVPQEKKQTRQPD